MKGKILSLVFAAGMLGCERIEYYPDKPFADTPTRMIAHRGGGTFDEGNTLAACQYGLGLADGIEVDVQRSIDNTLWLNHDLSTTPCGPIAAVCFPGVSDKTIQEMNACRGAATAYPQLEDIFKYMSVDAPGKYISLDVKPWAPCEGSGANVTRQMNEMAQSIIDLTKSYHLENRVMVESEAGDFLYYIKKYSTGIETYLLTRGDFELGLSRALANGYSGISFQFKVTENITKEQVDLLHRKGLKIQLWLVNEPADLEEAHALGVDFIQTDSF